MRDGFNEYPDYKECSIYDFESSSVTNYMNSISVSIHEVKCYCRSKGWDLVQSDGGSEESLQGIKSLCSKWIKAHNQVYYSTLVAVITMLGVNLIITYGFKLAF